APAMSDLSWLNPTPHAIAVYASRPLSPVATQHSLPSGRYPLLGPAFTGWIAPALPGAFTHSITSSARASNVARISTPTAFAVVRLMTRSNLVGCSTGRSAGLAPRKILSTKSAARRNWLGQFDP